MYISCHGNLARLKSLNLLVGFLPLIGSSNGLPKVKFVKSTIFEIIGGEGIGSNPPFVEGAGTKYLRTGRINMVKDQMIRRI